MSGMWSYTPYLWLFVLSAGVITALSVYAWRIRGTAAGQGFLLLMLCALIWAVGFIFETAVQTLGGKILFAKLQFLGLCFLPNAWLYLAFTYAGQVRSRIFWLSVLILPLITNLIIWFAPLPNWFYGNPSLDTVTAPFPVLKSDYQFWFYSVHAPSGYILTAIAAAVVIRAMYRAQPIYRKQGVFLLVAVFLPAITDVMYVLGYSPIRYYNFTSATFSISGLLLAWNLFRFRFLNLLPLARDVIFENLSDGIIVLDMQNRIVDFNPSARRMAELSASMLGQSVESLTSILLTTVRELQAGSGRQKDVAVGESPTLYYELKLSPINGRSGSRLGWVATLRDITDRTNLLQEVTRIASHDDLTGILGRKQFLELVDVEFEHYRQDRNHQLSYVVLDLDDFKNVNDTYGHAAGDQVLTVFAQECQKYLRSNDLFGRTGGDEFAILLVADAAKARVMAERLREVIVNLQIQLPEGKVSITVSLGLANTGMLQGSADELESLIKLADDALYRAKQGGKNQVAL